MASRSELAVVLASAPFRKLFTVRLSGQFFDGFFQSALATFVLFSPERQPSAASIAAAFAVLYLPYSLIGPFAGVLLDRWSRRQVLLTANLCRLVTVLVIAWQTSNGSSGLDFGLVVLITLGFNRFILSALAASLPHTVKDEALITANALSPTTGTIFAAAGGLLGIVAAKAIGGGDSASVTILIVAAIGFGASGLLSLRMPRRSLGPTGDLPGDSVGAIVRGFVDGARFLWSARPAFRAVAAVTVCRTAFGAATVLVIVMVRNTLNPVTEPDQALSQISLVIGGAAGGALVAALVTPSMSRRLGPVLWTCLVLVVSGIVTTIGLAMVSLPAFIVGGFFLGLASQSAKICADTAVQQQIHDDHLGRVFALYDVALNIGLVCGVTFAAFASPPSGESILGIAFMALLLIGTATWYFTKRNHPNPAVTDPAEH